jgi:alkane 1-monooxygenase
MKTYVATTPGGAQVEYVDRKRWLWSLALVYPLLPVAGIGWHAMTGNEWWLGLPLLLAYLAGPIIDWAIGEDGNNPPEEIVSQLEQDRYYRRLTFAAVPLHFISFIGAAVYAGTQQLSIGGWLALAIAAGLTSGLAINTAHELGHKNSRLEKWLAKITLAVPSYGHFTIDHNFGHHRNVATPGDPASARMGESIYRFALREIPGALREAWSLEKDRLARRGKSAWHPQNQILQAHALSALLGIQARQPHTGPRRAVTRIPAACGRELRWAVAEVSGVLIQSTARIPPRASLQLRHAAQPALDADLGQRGFHGLLL